MRERFADWLLALSERVRPKKKLVWKFGCKHGLPNFVHCPECDG